MKKILLVGLCYADVCSMKKFLEENFSVQVSDVTNIEEAKNLLKQRKFDLILVSRICVGDGKQGIILVDYVKQNGQNLPTILLTRFSDAQERAIVHGAATSFDMDLLIGYIRPSMKEKQKQALKILELILK